MLWMWKTWASQPRLPREKEDDQSLYANPFHLFPPKKMNAKELYAHIQSLTAQMDDDEKERFYDEAEKEGF